MQTIDFRADRAQQGDSAAGIYPRAAVLGLVTGLRATSGLTLLGVSARRGAAEVAVGRPEGLWNVLRARTALPVLMLLAAGELFADKQPWVPDRKSPLPLAGRVVLGALVGASVGALAGDRLRPRLIAGALGAAGAAAGAFGGFHARAWLGKRTRVPDAVWGAIEDSITWVLGVAAAPR